MLKLTHTNAMFYINKIQINTSKIIHFLDNRTNFLITNYFLYFIAL